MYVLSAIRSTLYAIRATNDEIALYNCREDSTTIESSLQISSFMQNKANFPDDQMNVNVFYTKEYEKKTLSRSGKNKANSKPNKANLLKAQMNVSSFLTKEYENKSNWTLDENKANTKPKQTQFQRQIQRLRKKK